MTTAKDISTMLPEGLRKEFEEFYYKQEPITWASGEYCSRCGSRVASFMRGVHAMWHKNLSCQLWMMKGWPIMHLEQHDQEMEALQAVISSILGFIDAEVSGLTGAKVPEENPEGEDPGQDCEEYDTELKADDKTIGHIHEDGTTHVHHS